MANDWFHGKLSRDSAEDLIKQDENEDGTFIVRESNSAVGDFVLTVLYQGEVCHYQIRRHGEDAFFSIDDNVKILHGLDTLVEFYREGANGLIAPLKKHVKKDPPPNDSRSHGVTNLLHRATKENNHTVVSELLKCGYRNVDAKNQDGQTAIHIAAQYCDEEILKTLLGAKVNVNCMDSIGNMPLHYACRNKSASFIRILIKANANVQGRNINNGYVPLHEAAKCGNLDAVKELLALQASLLPRTTMGEFPIDLAKEAHHDEVVDYLQNFKLPIPTTFQSKWYHGTLSRDEAVEALRSFAEKMTNNALTPSKTVNEKDEENPDEGNQPTIRTPEEPVDTSGCFLVRYSERTGYVLTLLWNSNVKNFIISQSSNYYYIDNGPYLPTLEHLVEHFMRFSDGLPVNLKHPVPPKPKPPLPFFSTMPRRNHKRSTDTSPLSPTTSPDHSNTQSPDGLLRKLSLDTEKENVAASGKKKQKENSSSVFSTLRLRSPRKKTKATTMTEEKNEKVASEHEQNRVAENLLKNLSFSTEFSNLAIAKPALETNAGDSQLGKLHDITLSSSLPTDDFYNIPKNNTAVVAGVTEGIQANTQHSQTTDSIEEKTEAEVEYFTKSDMDIERERMSEMPPYPQKFTINSNGYVPTFDLRVFTDPEFGEFVQEIMDTPAAELREFNIHPERLDSLLSTVSNESEVNRYFNRQRNTLSTTTLNSEAHATKPNYFIPSDCLELETVIGEGEFGSVYKGRLRRFNSSPVAKKHDEDMYFECAIKTLRDEHHRTKEFLREASAMIRLSHHCIVQLIGISKGESLMMIQELVPLGSMLNFILENKSKINPNYELKVWASQIACGMQFLESRHFVHRDLAARNILLASRHQAKISDFGLSRALGSGNDCYQASQGGKWPIKWYAPESFNNGLFSHASDVWSFGVTLWEMFSLGQPPYGEMRGVEAIQLISSGQRLPQPKDCPDHVYKIMRNCWNFKPKDRPTFHYLTDFFAKDPDYENLMDMIKTKHIG